ncbi:MAG TPA: hypothetical protein VF741_00630 [Candidatus Aquilonibacter sp.]
MTLRLGALLALVAALAACGGGSGSGSGSPGVPATASPQATATMMIAGSMTINGTALTGATVAYTCGCSAQAGETTTGSNGSYTITASATAIPASPNPTYTTVPGRNYMIIGYAASGTQAWTMEFLGKTQATDLNLSSTPTNLSDNATDTASTAAALYIFYESQNDSDQSFDLWNFNTIATWAQKLRAGAGLSAHETQLLSDVTTAQASSESLYPTVPVWNPQGSANVNATILADLQAVHSDGTAVDPALPTPCPAEGACTGAPTP